MSATDYRCKNIEDMATMPLIVYEISESKHRRKERILTIALVASVAVTVISIIVLR